MARLHTADARSRQGEVAQRALAEAADEQDRRRDDRSGQHDECDKRRCPEEHDAQECGDKRDRRDQQQQEHAAEARVDEARAVPRPARR